MPGRPAVRQKSGPHFHTGQCKDGGGAETGAGHVTTPHRGVGDGHPGQFMRPQVSASWSLHLTSWRKPSLGQKVRAGFLQDDPQWARPQMAASVAKQGPQAWGHPDWGGVSSADQAPRSRAGPAQGTGVGLCEGTLLRQPVGAHRRPWLAQPHS